MIFVHQPAAAVVIPSMKVPVDSPLVTKNSRHKISEAGFDTIVENLKKAQAAPEGKSREDSRLEYVGLAAPAGLDRPCHHFTRRSASGETWNVYLDPQSMLPRLVLAEDARGQLLERYLYREIHENPAELATVASFDPDARWGDSKGLLSRLARAAAGSSLPTSSASTTR